MTGNKPSTATDWIDSDDAPDLSTPEYQAKLAATPVRRGRGVRRRACARCIYCIFFIYCT